MMGKTHLAIGVFFVLLFLAGMPNKIVFATIALISSILPDIDSAYSTIGKYKVLRIFQFFVKHRGAIHSLTFCVALALIFSFFMPPLAFPFFLGYSMHLLADSLTLEGIMPFWPSKTTINGRVTTGSYTESVIFFVFILLSVFVVVIRHA